MAVLKHVETEQRDAFEAKKLRLPLAVARLLHSAEPLSRGGQSRALLAPTRQGVGQFRQAIGPQPRRPVRTFKPLAHASNSFLERSPRCQGGTAQELWFQHKANPLLGCESHGGIEPLHCQFLRLSAIEVKHRVVL